ncbi:DNA-directed RNA polymerase [Candidatus Woesearchaeota archaeon]|nr:DNA-directed RNA polymerase [Candidatus Woesearchaeota archaeon]
MRQDNRRGSRGGSDRRGGGRSFDRGDRGGGHGGGFNRGGFDRGPREMHKATCAECGNDCVVPFKPTEGKPVYCRECFAKRRPRRF